MIDLHTHSTFSDGSLTPEQLVRTATEIGLTALALTDHDCMRGMPQFLEACAKTAAAGYRDGAGLQGIPGVEISAEVPKGTLHMLGYYVDAADADLGVTLERILDGRDYRNRLILQKLNDLGMDLAWEEVASFAGEDVVGRPHFAQAMVARKFAADKDEAFEKYLAKGRKAYVDRFRLTPEESIATIHKAGGVAVLAHPFTLEPGRAGLRRAVQDLKALGLDGIEAFYSEHSPEQTAQYLGLARDFDLAATGGSDFHGDVNPGIRLGRGFGTLNVPDGLVAELSRRRAARG